MTPDRVAKALRPIAGITMTTDDVDRVTIQVADDIPVLTIAPSRLVGADALPAPDGSPAVRLAIRDANGRDGVIVYVTVGDIAFAPDPAAGSELVYPGGLLRTVHGVPAGVAFTEMMRALDAAPGDTDNLDRVAGNVVMCAAFWSGARRAGLDVDHLRPRLDALIEYLHSW